MPGRVDETEVLKLVKNLDFEFRLLTGYLAVTSDTHVFFKKANRSRVTRSTTYLCVFKALSCRFSLVSRTRWSPRPL